MTSLTEIIAPSFYSPHKAIKQHKYTHYWFGGGRGSTKSSFVSTEIVLGIMRNPDANAVALRKHENDLSESVFNQLLWAIDKLGVNEYWEAKKNPLKLEYRPTGQKILFRGADNPKKIKSTKFVKGYCRYIWYEEVDEIDGMEEIRNINQSLMRGGDLFDVLYSYNPPRSTNNWVNLVEIEQREDTMYHHSDYRSVPVEWLGEQFIIEAEHLKKVNPKAYEHEYLGIPVGTGGEVFTNVKLEQFTDEFVNSFANIRKGIDYGFAIDPFCFVQLNYDKTRRTIYIFDEIYQVGMSNTMASEQIKRKQKGNSYITADSAEPKSIAEMQTLGLRIKGAKKGHDSVEYGVKWLQHLDAIIIDSVRCPNIAKEFVKYEYLQDKNGAFISRYPDLNNHSIDAVRYALEDDTRQQMIMSNTSFIRT